MPVHIEIVNFRGALSALEAWQRLGWRIIGHAWDSQGPFTILGLRRL